MGAHGQLGKSTLYNEAVRVPFILHWPAGRLTRGVMDDIAASVDVVPTLAELLGLRQPPAVDGVSFAQKLRSQSSWTRPAQAQSGSAPARLNGIGTAGNVAFVESGTQSTLDGGSGQYAGVWTNSWVFQLSDASRTRMDHARAAEMRVLSHGGSCHSRINAATRRYLWPAVGSCRLWHRGSDPRQLVNVCANHSGVGGVARTLARLVLEHLHRLPNATWYHFLERYSEEWLTGSADFVPEVA